MQSRRFEEMGEIILNTKTKTKQKQESKYPSTVENVINNTYYNMIIHNSAPSMKNKTNNQRQHQPKIT